jgi:lipopolysaccharide export system protein LptA
VTENAYMEEAGRILKGDSLYYEQENGFGRARSNVEMIDTARNMILKGNFGLYYSEGDVAMVTDSALMMMVEGSDTMYVHADTLRTLQNTEFEEQSRILRAYYKVKILRIDLQVMCDSLDYVEADSVFNFYGEPVLWSGENQLTADQIQVHMVDQQMHRMELNGVALVISEKDTVSYDQMRGKQMTGSFKDNQLVKILVSGNGQTIYYAIDQGVVVGANKTACSDLTIHLKDNQISRVIYTSQPDGTYYPLTMFPEEEKKLSDFKWLEKWRPLSREEVFFWK